MTPSEIATTKQLNKITAASIIGTALEWYDYYLYGLASALIFGPLFFPGLGTLGGTLASFATFAVGFIVRPFGGVFFGVLGDKWGRKRVLIITLLLMGLATTAIGLIPDARSIGWMAPVLLVILRLVQGFGAGAEFGGAVLMCAETAPKRKRGFYACLPQIGVAIGGLMASGAFVLVEFLTTKEEFLAWGWRLPFLLSMVAVLVGLFIRLKVVESPVFEKLKSKGGAVESPFQDVVRTHRRSLLTAIGARFADNGVAYVYQTVVLTYAVTHLHKQKGIFLVALAISSFISIFATPAYGALSDRIGRRKVYMTGAIFSALIAFPFFETLQNGPDWAIVTMLVLALAVGKEMMSSPQASFFAELFDARVRYTGFSIAREVTSILGGMVPLVGASLLGWSGGAYWPVATLLVGMISVTIFALYMAPETKDREMDVDLFPAYPAGAGAGSGTEAVAPYATTR